MANTRFLENELTRIEEQVIEQQYPEYLAASGAILDIESPAGEGVKFYEYNLITRVGQAQVMATGAEDLPNVDIDRDKRRGQYFVLGNKYHYTTEEIANAEYAGVPLDDQLLFTARDVMENEYDEILMFGRSEHDLKGMIGFDAVSRTTVPNDGNSNGGNDNTEWEFKTPDQIYRDLTKIAEDMRIDTKYVYSPEIIGMPTKQFELISRTPYPSNSDSNNTILSYFLKQQAFNPRGVKSVLPIPRLEGRFPGGTDGMVAFTKRSNWIKGKLAQNFTRKASQERDLNIYVPCYMKVGGTVILQPMSVRESYGI